MRVYTEAVQFKADQKLIDFIERKLSKMDQFFDKIIDARVVLKLENSGQIRDKVAELQLTVPGEKLFVRDTQKTFEAAVDSAANALRRRLIRYKKKVQKF